MDNIKIRRANENDIEDIVHFNEAMAIETENKVLDHNTITNGVTRLSISPSMGFMCWLKWIMRLLHL